MHQLLVDEASVHRASLRHWNFSDPESVSMLFCVVGRGEVGREAYLDALEAVETVQEYEATVIDDGRFYVYLQETAHGHGLRIRTLLADTDLVVVPPIEYLDDGVMRLEVAGDQDHLRTLVAGLPDQLSVSVNRLGEYDVHREAPAAVLTDRQREVVRVAQQRGYYDIPRETNVRDIADELGCSKSTVTNHLRKAEARLMTLVTE